MWKKCKQGSEIAAMNNEPLVFFLPDLPFCTRPFFILSDTQSKVSVPRARAIERACEFWKKKLSLFWWKLTDHTRIEIAASGARVKFQGNRIAA